MYFALDPWNDRIHSTPRHSVTGPKMTNDILSAVNSPNGRSKVSQASDVVVAVVMSLVASWVMSWATWDCLQGTASCYMLFINSAFCWSLSEILAFDSIRQSTSWQCPGKINKSEHKFETDLTRHNRTRALKACDMLDTWAQGYAIGFQVVYSPHLLRKFGKPLAASLNKKHSSIFTGDAKHWYETSTSHNSTSWE